MKAGGGRSTLNPNAAPYIPRSERELPNVPNQGMGNVHQDPQISIPKKSSKIKTQEEIDMELEYLIITFSDLSHESIYDVYLANDCDLDDTIEMITQLEILSSEATDNAVILPETLGIGDVTETPSSSSSTSGIPKDSSS